MLYRFYRHGGKGEGYQNRAEVLSALKLLKLGHFSYLTDGSPNSIQVVGDSNRISASQKETTNSETKSAASNQG
jgi:hypothetical protein